MKKQSTSKCVNRIRKAPMTEVDSHVALKWHAVSMAIVILAGIAAYSNNVQGSFHFDDIPTIILNPSIRSLNPFSVWAGNNHFRFLGFYSFALNYHWGGLAHLRGWHYVNIGLHIICCLLLYLVLCRLVEEARLIGNKIPFMASVLFAAHPIFSEPVNYIQARLVLFYTMFSLLGVLFTILLMRARQNITRILTALCVLASIILGGLSKEVGLFYAFGGVGLYLFTFGVKERKVRKAIFIILGSVAIFTVMCITAKGYLPLIFKPIHHFSIGETTFITRVLTNAQVFWGYISLIIPSSSRLNADHYVKVVSVATAPQILVNLIPLIGMGAIVGFAFMIRSREALVSFLLLWVVMGALPYMPAAVTIELMVEYKFYFPAIGLMSLLAWGFERACILVAPRLSQRFANIILWTMFGILAVYCVKETRDRNRAWASELTLWSDAVKKSPQKCRPHSNLGVALAEQGRLDEAIAHYLEALRISPAYAEAHSNLGVALAEQGRFDEAIAHDLEALRIHPAYAEAHNNLGNMLVRLGKPDDAIGHYAEALRIRPRYADALNNLGAAYSGQGRIEKAISCYSEALRLNPNCAEAHKNLGNALLEQGKLDEAIAHYNEALRIKPDFAYARSNLESALQKKGKPGRVLKTIGNQSAQGTALPE
jgi:protein O-mannosyl-transferase